MGGEAGDLEGALKAYEDAKRIREMTHTMDTQPGADLLMNMGAAKEDMGNLDSALQDFVAAKRVHEKIGTLGTVNGARLMTFFEALQAKMQGKAPVANKTFGC